MKKKLKKVTWILSFLLMLSLGLGLTSLFINEEKVLHVEAEEARFSENSQESDSQQLIAALEDEAFWVNGIPYVEVETQISTYSGDVVSRMVNVTPNLMVDTQGYITKVSPMNGVAEIPATTINGTAILGINGKAFNNIAISGVILPTSITILKSEAFYNCRSLETITWQPIQQGETVNDLIVEEKAFFSCLSLVNITLPKRLTNLNNKAFHNCKNLQNIYIEPGCVGYKNGPDGYSGVVFTSQETFIDVSTSYIWPKAKKVYEVHLILHEDEDQYVTIFSPAGHSIELPYEVYGEMIWGWCLDEPYSGEVYTTEFLVPENSDIGSYTLYAQTSAGSSGNCYILTFDLQGGIQQELQFPMLMSIGESVDLSLYLPVRDGYDFNGWYSLPAQNGIQIIDSDGIGTANSINLSSMTLYASWIPHTYTIRFYDYNGTQLLSLGLSFGTNITSALPERQGYTFKGWYDGLGDDASAFTDSSNEFFDDAWSVQSDRVLDFYAHHDANIHNFSLYCSKCDETYEGYSTLYNSTVVVSPPCAHNGYELDCWRSGNNEEKSGSFIWTYAQDQAFKVIWTPKQYDITYMEDGSQIYPSGYPTKYTIETNISFPTITKTGYNSVYWEDGGNNTWTGITPGHVNDLTLYFVKEDPIQVIVTLNYYGVYSIETMQATYGNILSLPYKGLTGYGNAIWEDIYGNEISYSRISYLLSNVTYYAKWETEVTLKDRNGNIVGYELLQYGKSFSLDPYEEVGYTFNGWATSQSSTTYITDAEGDGLSVFSLRSGFILYARMSANSYTITFNNHGGAGTNQMTVTYGQTPTVVSIPTRPGYNFTGYYSGSNGQGVQQFNANGRFNSGVWQIDSDVTLHAHWVPKPITITFDRTKLKIEPVNLKESLASITIKFYDSSKNYLDSRTKARLNNNNWTDNSNVIYTSQNQKAYYYTISYTMAPGYYDGVYWHVIRGGEQFVTDGSGTVSTTYISLGSTENIDCCTNVMYFESYEYLTFDIKESYYSFPAYWSWRIDIYNNNLCKIKIDYLTQLCHSGDALVCGGIQANHNNPEIEAGGAHGAYINHNGTGGYVTACYITNSVSSDRPLRQCKLITYANNLSYDSNKDKGSCTEYHNLVIIS